MEAEMLNKKGIGTIGLAALGAMLEYYDFVVYLFVAAAISETFFPKGISPWVSQMQTFGIFAAGYLARPVAGVVLSHFADLIGRKKMFIFLILMMAVPTLLIGILPTYQQIGVFAPISLLLLRIMQGCAVGGELPGASVFVAEHASPSRLATACGSLQCVVAVGLLLGTGVAELSVLASAKFGHPSLAWRLPFLIGGVFGLVAAYMRRQLHESPLYLQIQQSRQLAKDIPAKIVLTDHVGACLIALGLTFAMACGSSIFFQYMPTLLITGYGIPKPEVFNAILWGTVAYALAMPVWGGICDTLGWARGLVIGAIAIFCGSVYFFQELPGVAASHGALGPLFAIAGVAASSAGAITPGMVSALFPTNVRQTGYAIPYNVGMAVFAGLMPLTLAWLVRGFGPGVPVYPLVVGAFIMIGLAFALRGARLYLGKAQQPDALASSARRIG
jgi:nitrate/nitrite transporter NarK